MESFRVGNVISQSFHVWFGMLVPFAGVTVLVDILPSYALQSALESGLLLSVLGFVLMGLLEAALTVPTLNKLRERPVVTRDYLAGMQRLAPVVGVSVLSYLMVAAVFLPAGMAFGAGSRVGTLLLGLAGVVFFVLLTCRYFVVIPVVVFENASTLEAFRRSQELTKGSRLKVFGLLVLVMVMLFVVAIPMAVILADDWSNPDGLPYSIATLALSVAFTSLLAVLSVTTYHELRTAREGMSTDDMAEIFE